MLHLQEGQNVLDLQAVGTICHRLPFGGQTASRHPLSVLPLLKDRESASVHLLSLRCYYHFSIFCFHFKVLAMLLCFCQLYYFLGIFLSIFMKMYFRFSYFRISILNENEICDAGPQNQPLSVNFFSEMLSIDVFGLLG